jgi:hypothetical protein
MSNEKRLIDANALITNLRSFKGLGKMVAETLVRFIKKQPTVDAVEVVHGRWMLEQDYGDGTADYKCSNCEYDDNFFTKTLEIYIKYCPYCGAKMDGGNEDG